MTTYKMNLSMTEPNNYIGMVKVRQYDTESQTFDVYITESGVPADITDLAAFFCVKSSPVTGLGISEQIVSNIVDAKNGHLRYTLTDYDMQQVGLHKAYFAFRKFEGDGYRYKHQFSTKDFAYTVMPSIVSDGIKDSNYIWTFEEILRYFQEWVQESMKTYDDWYVEAQKELERIINEFNSWIAANQDIYDEWISGQKTDFVDWFESIRDILDENAAGNLQNQFDKINANAELIEIEHDAKSYPAVRALYWEYGMATVPLEDEPTGLGGGNVITINSAVEYLDRSSLKVSVPRYYKLVNPEVILLKNAVRLISDHRVLQIEFESDVNISAPVEEVTITCDYVNKVANSTVENANIAKIATLNTVALPDNKSFYEFSAGRYAGIKQLNDSQVFNISNVTNGNMVQILLSYNIVDALERYDSNYFSDRGATTIVEKVTVAREQSTKLNINTYGFGRGATGTMLTMNVFDKTSWHIGVNHTESTSSLLNQIVDSSYITDEGLVHVLVRAEAADATVASAVAIDYANLELTFLDKKWY